ncbi:MAG: bifunctional UDP-N-acetylglucosamine diphosphorylase/glucosamine-1-phosphate N-acetyltransferase GlmU [Clostridiales bacterium]|nr:bifunctional UDP-N-acetylglucosamine diphosphorylase/glucosamine-1-phosphate N-acetyltransferase GlmU [Clostridiales bacterium]
MNHCAVVLAAGEGTRMQMPGAKVLLPVLGKPMIDWVIGAVLEAGVDDCCLIVGKDLEQVRARVGDGVCYALQLERKGTGHAVRQAEDFLRAHSGGHCLVLAGDSPLISGGTIRRAGRMHLEEGNAVTVISAVVGEPFGYGRIVRDVSGGLLRIVEEKDADPNQRRICEINSSAYWFEVDALLEALPEIGAGNEKGEYYLTDAVEILLRAGRRAGAYVAQDADEILGANTQRQLLTLQQVALGKVLDRHLENGVMISSVDGLTIGPDVVIGPGTVLHQGCRLLGSTRIGAGCVIGPGSVIEDSEIGDGVTVNASQVYRSRVGDKTRVGPFAHIRPDCVVGEEVKIGNFVELKNSTIGKKTSIAHLTYVGDADIGSGVNLGCGVVTVNYDGRAKYRTTVRDRAFVGCNVNLVAPVEVGEGAYVAAGSTITSPVPADALAIARARQENKEDWVKKREGQQKP